MQIIEEGKIAYMHTGWSVGLLGVNQKEIFEFYNELDDFEHFIIDLRGNTGGDLVDFLDVILRPLIKEPIKAPLSFHFFKDGPHVRRWGDSLFLPTATSGYLTISEPYRPVAEILKEFHLPEAHLPDFEKLDYGAPSGRAVTVRNAIETHIHPFNAIDFNPPDFSGKIWLLTDKNIFSSAQLSAWYAKETGFATLVGDITGGTFGGPRTLVLLPNTGIAIYFDVFYITDSRGRPLEAGTIPHHFNREGLDALETVLALIKEGS
jgi:hypothetical protein